MKLEAYPRSLLRRDPGQLEPGPPGLDCRDTGLELARDDTAELRPDLGVLGVVECEVEGSPDWAEPREDTLVQEPRLLWIMSP